MAIAAEHETIKNNSNSTYLPCFCHSCGIEIWFSDDFMTPFNKKIPLDMERNDKGNVQFHECLEKRQFSLRCKYCDEPISFSNAKLSKNGKKIPLTRDGSQPHNCSKNPYNLNRAKFNFRTGGTSGRVHKTLEEKHAEFLRKEEEFRRQWR